jgi:hypothetical protein
MLRICLFLAGLLTITIAQAQIVYTWNGGSGFWNLASNWSPNGIPSTNDIVQFNNGASQTVSAITNSVALGRLRVTNNTNVTLQHTANRTISINNGTGTDFQVDAGCTLIMGNGISVTLNNNATAAINGTLEVSDRTFTTDNPGNSTIVTGRIENTGGTVVGTAARLTFQNGSTYQHARPDGAIPDATWNINSTCLITGLTNSDASNDGQAFGNLVYDCPLMSGNRSTGGAGLSIGGNFEIRNLGTAMLQLATSDLDVDGDLILQQGVFRVGSNTNRTINVDGNLSLSGGTLLMSSGSNTNDIGTINLAGNLTITGGAIDEDDDGSGLINFNGTAVQTYTKTGGALSNEIDFAILGGSSVDFGTSVLDGSSGSFTLNTGGKIITASGIYSGVASGAIRVSGTRSYSSGGDYEFTGSSTGVFTTNPTAFTARDIIVNNSSGSVALSQPMSVTRRLRLTNGELNTTAANTITVNDNAISDGYSNLSFVVGPIIKKGNDDFEFPTGRTGVGLMPVKISGLSATSDFLAEYKRAAPITVAPSISAAGLHHLSFCEYWILNRIGSATANVTLYWNPNSICNAASYVTDLASIVIAHSNGTSWNSFGRTGGTTGNISSGTVTWNNVAAFSPFALGSTSPGLNPLPVLLNSEKVFEKGSGIAIDWTNSSEKDIFHYVVQRSTNGIDFSDLFIVIPASNQSDKATYEVVDKTPIRGKAYYRIKAIEISGREILSKLLRIETNITTAALTIYPNPVTNRQVQVSLTGVRAGKFTIRVISANGVNVMQKFWSVPSNSVSQSLLLPASLPAGVYSLVVVGSDFYESRPLLVR